MRPVPSPGMEFQRGVVGDHLSDSSRERGGAAFEAFRPQRAGPPVPGKHFAAVAAHLPPPGVLQAATMLDLFTGARFIRAGRRCTSGHEAFARFARAGTRSIVRERGARRRRAVARGATASRDLDSTYPLDRPLTSHRPHRLHAPLCLVAIAGGDRAASRATVAWPLPQRA